MKRILVLLGIVLAFALPDRKAKLNKFSVDMKSGETFAICGPAQLKAKTVTTVPVLGDLPMPGGESFRPAEKKENAEELLILVTPRRLDPEDSAILPKYLPGRESRSPDDFECSLKESWKHPADSGRCLAITRPPARAAAVAWTAIARNTKLVPVPSKTPYSRE